MRRQLASAGTVAAAIALGACQGGSAAQVSPVDELREAVQSTLAGGPVTAIASTMSPAGTNVIDGNLDPEPAFGADPGSGLRMCGEIRRALVSGGFGEGGFLYLSADDGAYSSVIKLAPTGAGERSSFPTAPGCEAGGWFDDHPPTLALFNYDASARPRYPEGAETGAESYMQLALLALAEFDRGAGEIREIAEQTYEVDFDFPAADQVPKGRSEDRWVLEPLIRKTGERPIEFLVADGHVRSVAFSAPGTLEGSSAGDVEVELALGAPGSGEPVAGARVVAME